MSYTVRGMRGDSAKVVEEFGSLEEARVLFEQLKTSDRYSSVELDDITDPDNPDMVDIVELGGGEEEEEEEEEEEKEEEWMCKNCDPSYKGRKDLFCIRADGGDCGMGLPHYQPPMEAAIKCQPSTCTEEGCGANLKKAWRFVAKCRVHGGREGV